MSETQEASATVYLHFVGSGLYGQDRFEAEAKKMGIQRAVNFQILRGMKWGDPVFLAEYVSEMVPVGAPTTVPTNANPLGEAVEKKKAEKAIIFGVTYIEGISYNLPDEVKAKVVPKLTVIATIEATGRQDRMCGSYIEGGGFEVTDTLEQIVGYIVDACQELNLDPRTFKYFVRGHFVKLDPTRTIFNQTFFRGFKKISLPDAPTSPTMSKASMVYVYDYGRRKYLKKEDRERLDSLL